MDNMTYIAIDLKSFYASVECRKRGLNPLDTNLVVADPSRTDKTICLAVTPALKSYGVPGRARLFQVNSILDDVNRKRREKTHKGRFTGKSCYKHELDSNPDLEIDYIIAEPHMAHYIECSKMIYKIYLKYISKEDIHVYSIDEVFIDATSYLNLYKMNAHELTIKIIKDILDTTGITATAGIGSNLYLAKIAMDIVAKHQMPDKDGVRIAELDEMKYRKELWAHRPLTDFWRVGSGIANKLEKNYIYTMGDIAKCSLGKDNDYYNEDLLFKLFGVNAELLIDHAWGYESCTMKDIKAYKPLSNSLGSSQVLQCPYTYDMAMVVALEMADSLALDLIRKNLRTSQLTFYIGYDVENVYKGNYRGEFKKDYCNRDIPMHAHKSVNLSGYTASSEEFSDAVKLFFSSSVDKSLTIRRVSITATKVVYEEDAKLYDSMQPDLFADSVREKEIKLKKEKETSMQKALLSIKDKYGKNSILKGISYENGATAKERNNQIGGHKA